MAIQIEAIIEFYGKFALQSNRERDRLRINAEHSIANQQVADFLQEKYAIHPPYSLLLNGHVWQCGDQSYLQDGCRFKLIPIN